MPGRATEADNLCRWFGWELAAVELALRLPASKFLPDNDNIRVSHSLNRFIHLCTSYPKTL